MSDVSYCPESCSTISAYLVVKDAQQAIDFYANCFHGQPGACMKTPDGQSVMHGEVHIGDSTLMLSQENPQWGTQSAETMGGSPASLHLYVEDVDALFKHALQCGCQEVFPVMDMFWGDRYGKLVDPFGYQWGIATHQEDVAPDEMERRAQEWFAKMGNPDSCEGAKSDQATA